MSFPHCVYNWTTFELLLRCLAFCRHVLLCQFVRRMYILGSEKKIYTQNSFPFFFLSSSSSSYSSSLLFQLQYFESVNMKFAESFMFWQTLKQFVLSFHFIFFYSREFISTKRIESLPESLCNVKIYDCQHLYWVIFLFNFNFFFSIFISIQNGCCLVATHFQCTKLLFLTHHFGFIL